MAKPRQVEVLVQGSRVGTLLGAAPGDEIAAETPSGRRGPRDGSPGCVRAPGLPGAEAAPFHAGQGTAGDEAALTQAVVELVRRYNCAGFRRTVAAGPKPGAWSSRGGCAATPRVRTRRCAASPKGGDDNPAHAARQPRPNRISPSQARPYEFSPGPPYGGLVSAFVTG